MKEKLGKDTLDFVLPVRLVRGITTYIYKTLARKLKGLSLLEVIFTRFADGATGNKPEPVAIMTIRAHRFTKCNNRKYVFFI